MAIPTVTAPLPAENSEPWIVPRNLLDNQLKATANAAAAGIDALEAARGANSGIATLDAGGKLTPTQLPALAVTEFLGSSANQAAMLALVGQQGDWTTRTDRGTVFIITGADPSQLSSWTEMSYPTAPVTSVAGRTGAVVLAKADVGLGNVDNTSDANKPVSTAQAAAIGAKADDNAVVKLSGNQTIAGTKTFSSAPAVPDSSFAIAKTTGLQAALDGKVATSRTVAGYALTADVPRAGLSTRGLGEAVFIPNGGTVPAGTPAYTIIIEAAA